LSETLEKQRLEVSPRSKIKSLTFSKLAVMRAEAKAKGEAKD